MTNNPTIDGVSREDQRHDAVKVLHDVMQAVPSASLYSLAEAVLDTGYEPAVERQEPVAIMGNFTEGAPCVWFSRPADGTLLFAGTPELATLQSTIAQLEDKLNKAIDLDFQRRETIARLEARVQELESGRGEADAWALLGGGGLIRDLTDRWGVAKHWEGDIRSLYFDPPAPVAVLLPDRIPFTSQGTFDQGWNACLDATAALNGVKS